MPEIDEKAVDALAQAWASIDGKLKAYENERGLSTTEVVARDLPGHFGGYQAEAEEMIRRLRARGFDVVPTEPTRPRSEPSAEMVEGVRTLRLSDEMLEVLKDPENTAILPAGVALIDQHLTPDFVDDGNCCAGKLAEPLRIGSRLTVDGVEAVVVAVDAVERALAADAAFRAQLPPGWERDPLHEAISALRAMLSPEALGGGE